MNLYREGIKIFKIYEYAKEKNIFTEITEIFEKVLSEQNEDTAERIAAVCFRNQSALSASLSLHTDESAIRRSIRNFYISFIHRVTVSDKKNELKNLKKAYARHIGI